MKKHKRKYFSFSSRSAALTLYVTYFFWFFIYFCCQWSCITVALIPAKKEKDAHFVGKVDIFTEMSLMLGILQ